MTGMSQRKELKYLISAADAAMLRARLAKGMAADPYADRNGMYRVHSLYFDDPENSALYACLDSAGDREKFRLRWYGRSAERVLLERKMNRKGMTVKYREILSRDEAERILRGEIEWMKERDSGLLMLFYERMKTRPLRPVSCVHYDRRAFVAEPGGVRVTLDDGLRAGLPSGFPEERNTVPVHPGRTILEVKTDFFVPAAVQRMLSLKEYTRAFSKYVASRVYR